MFWDTFVSLTHVAWVAVVVSILWVHKSNLEELDRSYRELHVLCLEMSEQHLRTLNIIKEIKDKKNGE